jgi:hypothetical protein
MKKNIFATLKSILILALAALAVFQVSQLWLVNFTNRNFFLYLQARFPPSAPDGQSAFAQPFRIVSGAGDGLFSIRYSEIADSNEWLFSTSVLDAILQHGVFSGETTMSQVISRPVLICEYTFAMCAETFAAALGQRSSTLLTDVDIENFSGVAIQPTGDEALRVFFIDATSVWEFNLHTSRRHAPDDFRFVISPANPERPHFIATHDGFLPVVPRGILSYNAVLAENPFQDAQGLFTLTHIRGKIESFFDNPATIIPSVSGVDNVYTFSNRNTMVRYLENAVLEYTSYRTISRSSPDNFMMDFSAALAFVRDDPYVKNEIFLRNHETRERTHIFWFDYVIDNRPMVFAEEWRTGPLCADPLFAPIEVIVDHGRVVRYRRLAYNFSSGGLTWTGIHETDEFFSLGFVIDGGDKVNLEMLQFR